MAPTKDLAGLRKVVVGETRISSIDGIRGILAYGGIDIHALAEHSHFEEVAFLLQRGVLPSRGELGAFKEELKREGAIPTGVLSVLKDLPRGTHPMAALRTLVSALGAFEEEAFDDSQPAQLRKATRLTAQMAILVASLDRVRSGQVPIPPDPTLSHAANFLYMLKGTPPSEEAAGAMDLALVLHADHEFNASTFAARVVVSTLGDMHGAVTAALATLKGSLHGGANEAVMRMLEAIGSVDQVGPWLTRALDSKHKIMGFGHAVYKTEDPRATHLRKLSKEMGEKHGAPIWYALSERIEAFMKERKGLNPNVDFYSASVYHLLGIPTDLFTPVFAISRIAGWTAHILEQLANNRLIRPDSEYVGPRDQPYLPVEKR